MMPSSRDWRNYVDGLGLSDYNLRCLQEELGRQCGFDVVATERIAALEAEVAIYERTVYILVYKYNHAEEWDECLKEAREEAAAERGEEGTTDE